MPLLFLVLMIGVTVATWRWYFNNRPLKDADFTTITGTLKSVKEMGSAKSPFLEFYIEENPARFRIPMDGYKESFDRNGFFANVKAGQKIIVTAERNQIQNPLRPPLDPVPTVFVYGLRDGKITYSTLVGRKNWEKRNRQMGLYFAIGLSIVTVGFIGLFTAFRKQLFAPSKLA